MSLLADKRIIVLVGPSGSGKTTIGNELSTHGIRKLVTTTTREPRPGESEGIDYYFIEKDSLPDDAFIERTEYSGNIYGLTKAEIDQALSENDLVHVSMDRNGAKAMLEAYPKETYVVFIESSADVLKKRMEERGDSAEDINNRIAFLNKTNEATRPDFAHLSIKNDKLHDSVETILHIK